jgi:hypothetical protein
MDTGTSSLFSQLLSLVDRNDFRRLVSQTGSEDRSKGFQSWDHFVSMLFCQLGGEWGQTFKLNIWEVGA